MDELLTLEIINFDDLENLIEESAPENGCTSPGSGACCPKVKLR